MLKPLRPYAEEGQSTGPHSCCAVAMHLILRPRHLADLAHMCGGRDSACWMLGAGFSSPSP